MVERFYDAIHTVEEKTQSLNIKNMKHHVFKDSISKSKFKFINKLN